LEDTIQPDVSVNAGFLSSCAHSEPVLDGSGCFFEGLSFRIAKSEVFRGHIPDLCGDVHGIFLLFAKLEGLQLLGLDTLYGICEDDLSGASKRMAPADDVDSEHTFSAWTGAQKAARY
jgi:hypothetical protein